jgi:protein-S-isoprenylcysteine O-methyltransferase Ste14
MESQRIAYLADFAGRALLIAIFGFVATNKIAGAIAFLRDAEGARYLEFAASVASLAFVLLVMGMTIVRYKPVGNAEGIEPRVSALAGTGLAMGIAMLPLANVGVSIHVTAVIMIMIGWMLSVYVLLWLGRAFSIMAQARKLVTAGPYSIVRHPLYLCEEIAVLGIALSHISIEAVLILIVQWLFQLRRMTNEEKVLRASFPEYDAYAKQTPKVIPRLVPQVSMEHL